jgi:hypothetical protein
MSVASVMGSLPTKEIYRNICGLESVQRKAVSHKRVNGSEVSGRSLNPQDCWLIEPAVFAGGHSMKSNALKTT